MQPDIRQQRPGQQRRVAVRGAVEGRPAGGNQARAVRHDLTVGVVVVSCLLGPVSGRRLKTFVVNESSNEN